MNTDQTTPPPIPTPASIETAHAQNAWTLSVCDDVASLSYKDRLAATARAMPAQVALLTTVRDRLNTRQAVRDAS